MITAQAANLLAQVDALKKHELAFLNLHRQLLEEIVSTGRKYSKFTPGTILQEKGIRYYSAVMGKRVDYERLNENAYRKARAALLVTLRRIGAGRPVAKSLFQRWSAIEQMLPKIEKAIMDPWYWVKPKGRKAIYETAERLFELQQQIVELLTRLEQVQQH